MGKETLPAGFKLTLGAIVTVFVVLVVATVVVAGMPSTETTKSVVDGFSKGIFTLIGAFGGLLGGKAIR